MLRRAASWVVCAGALAGVTGACVPPRDRDAGDAAPLPSDEAGDVSSTPEATAPLDAPDDAPLPPDASGFDSVAPPPDGPAPPDGAAPPEAAVEPCPVAGLRRCAGRCVDIASDSTNCGACGVTCEAAPNATTACNSGECERTCARGFGDCDSDAVNGCEASLSTRAHCGACGRACAASETCGAGACVPSDRAPPPQLFAPLSGTRVPSRRPELRFLPLAGGAGTQVQLCRERSCAAPVATLEATGGRAQPAAALDPGVYFWRARTGAAGLYSSVYSPVWQFRVTARDAAAGVALGAEPDFNGDGLADVAVGAWQVDRGTGEAYVYYGARANPSTTPDWRFRGTDGTRSSAGMAVTSVGDVNGDGFTDLLVGVPDAAFFSGRALVFFGGALGLPAAPSWVVPSPIGGGRLGAQAAAVGDVNADGYADFALGATGTGGGDGFVLIFRGGAGASPTAALQQIGAPAGALRFGQSIAGLGDANGDGFVDLAAGAAGRVAGGGPVPSSSFVFSGAGSMLAPVAALALAGTRVGDRGVDLAGAGDVNGDGLGDLLRGSVYADAASLHLGATGGLSRSAAFALERCAGDVGGGGDVDGDGFDDMLFACGGEVTLVYGAAGSIGGRRATLRHRTGVTASGPRVTIVGDVNGDGFADVLVGVPEFDSFRGTVSLYLGGRDGVSETPAWFVEGVAASDLFGDALAGG